MATTGSLEPARQGRPPGGGKLAPYAELLSGWVDAQGDITMLELEAKLQAERGGMVHPASLSRFLIVLGYSIKVSSASNFAAIAPISFNATRRRDISAPPSRRASRAHVVPIVRVMGLLPNIETAETGTRTRT